MECEIKEYNLLWVFDSKMAKNSIKQEAIIDSTPCIEVYAHLLTVCICVHGPLAHKCHLN